MSETRRETFEVEDRPTIELKSLPSGEAIFVEGEVGKVQVEVTGNRVEDFAIEQDGERIVLRAPRGRDFSRLGDYTVLVRTPPVVRLSAKVASADVDVRVEAEEVSVNSASGEVRIGGTVGVCGINTASGDVRIGRVRDECGVNSASGNVSIGEAMGECGVNSASGDMDISFVGGELGIKSASGDVRVRVASGEAGIRTASGDLVVERYEGPDIECVTQSGDVRIGLPGGRDVDLQLDSLSGEMDVRFDDLEDDGREEPGEEMSVSARTLSGDITLFKA